MDMFLRARKQTTLTPEQVIREHEKHIHDLKVAINTLAYCYEQNPRNFGMALAEAQHLADRKEVPHVTAQQLKSKGAVLE